MMIATMTWLIARTTLVPVLASLVIGSAKDAMSPAVANARKYGRGRPAHLRQAAASRVPATPPSRRAAQAMFIIGMRANRSSNTGPRTQRELSQVLKCTPRNVTGLVDALEAAGFVERTAHPTDRRAIMVGLSKQGQSLIAGWAADREHGTAQVLGGIPADQLAVFSAVLDRVLTQLRATYA
jgi:DNA-binding MarR family transcriptional regulator